MIARGVRAARLLLLGAALALAPGCTIFDDEIPLGTSFSLEQPEARVTLEGEMHADLITEPSAACPAGGTIFWGAVRNTGDVNVSDVSIVIEVFNAGGAVLGSFSGSVFNGEVIDPTGEGGITQYGTNLEIDQAGTFNVCTPVPFGSAATTRHETRFVVIDEGGN